MTQAKITFQYILTIAIVVFVTWIIHEFAHWATGELLGHDTTMRLNGTHTVYGDHETRWHSTFISAAGPIITILQGILAFLFLKRKGWNSVAYALLFMAFYMRFLAGIVSYIRPNDEARISEFLGLGTYTLPLVVSAFLFFLVYRISKKYALNWKFQLTTTLAVMVFSSLLIMADQYFKMIIL